jgi:hypothetical protein
LTIGSSTLAILPFGNSLGLVTVDRVETGEHHRLGLGVAGQGDGGGAQGGRDGVADLGLAHVLHAGDQVADLADAEPLAHGRFGRGDADLEDLVGCPGGHHLDLLARVQLAVDHAHIGDHAAVAVVDGVEDHRAGGGGRVADRGRDQPGGPVEQFGDADAGLAGDAEHVVGAAADQAGQLLRVLVRVGRRQVDLVQHRDDGEVVLQGQVEVRERLGLDALGCVDEQDRALAGGQAAGDLVGEVDVAGGVDHVQGVGLPVELPRHPHGLALDGDAALALDIHPVQVLGAHGPVVDDAGDLQHPVGQRRLSVVDVGNDAEVTDELGRCCGRFKRSEGSR